VPFCEDCAKYWAPSAMGADGTCPSCDRPLDEPVIAATTPRRRVTADDLDLKKLAGAGGDDPAAPWHFKLLVTGVVLYVGWRIVDLFI
jgi:hypothetical protein